MAANAAAKKSLDPNSIDGLVYAQTPAGTEVLAAAMYVLPSRAHQIRPCPTARWSSGISAPMFAVVRATGVNVRVPSRSPGIAPCPAGSAAQPTPYMTMVWQVPVAGGPLAIQPPDIQIVEAATMQTSS